MSTMVRCILFIGAFVLTVSGSASKAIAQSGGWSDIQTVLASIQAPQFPSKEFSILQYGAVGDGITDCTAAFARAVDACASSGGGTVLVPVGTYATGAIHLKSNVRLHVVKNAVIAFSTDPRKYLPLVLTRWEGMELMNYSPLIYAYGETNIAVTGEGTLDGRGANERWWSWKGIAEYGWTKGMPDQKPARDRLMAMVEKNIPAEQRVFGEGSFLRPSFIQFYRCSNILIAGVTLKDSPMWFINPVLSRNITVENVTVVGLGPNNDGCNPESSVNVLIRNCTFNTGDDCIAIKSGRNNDGRRINVPSENIVIQRCTMMDGHGGVVVGSEVSGGAKNIFIEDCTMDSPNLDRALRFKTNSVRGGTIENVFARNITVGQVAEAVVLADFYYEEGDTGAHTPQLRNVHLQNITSAKGKYGFYLRGYQRSPISGITAADCSFNGITNGNVFEQTTDITFTRVSINGKPLLAP